MDDFEYLAIVGMAILFGIFLLGLAVYVITGGFAL